MKNFVHRNEAITVVAPSAVESGEVVVVGNLFGIAVAAAANGEEVSLATAGVFLLPKAAVTFAAGAFAYWDGTQLQNDDNAGANFMIGIVTMAAGSGASHAQVRLVDPGNQTIVGSLFDVTQKLDADTGVVDTDFEATIDSQL